MDIKTAADLKAAIALLEVDVSVKKTIMTEQFHATRESLNPSNIIKNTLGKVKDAFQDMVESGDLVEKIVGTSIGFGAGVLTKKIVIGKSTNIFKRILGTAIELGVANVVSKNADTIKEKGLSLWRKFTRHHNGQEK